MKKLIQRTADLPFPKTFSIVFSILCLVLPGILLVAYFLGYVMDFGRFIFLAASIVFPLYMLLGIGFVFYTLEEEQENSVVNDRRFYNAIVLAGIVITIESTVTVLIGDFVGFRLDYAYFVYAIAHLIVLIHAIRGYRSKRKSLQPPA